MGFFFFPFFSKKERSEGLLVHVDIFPRLELLLAEKTILKKPTTVREIRRRFPPGEIARRRWGGRRRRVRGWFNHASFADDFRASDVFVREILVVFKYYT